MDAYEEKKSLIKTAFLYSQEGKWGRAIEAYEKIVEIDPNDFNAYNALGEMYAKRGLVKEAFQNYLKAVEGYEKQGNSMRAANVYRKASLLDLSGCDLETKARQDLISRLSMALDAMESEDNDKALEMMLEAKKIYPASLEVKQRLAELYAVKMMGKEASSLYWEIANSFLVAGDKLQAYKVAQRVLTLDPSHEGAKTAVEELKPEEA